MARLLIMITFALVASLCSATDASWFEKVKRTDLGENCPTCGGSPSHPDRGSWADWSITFNSIPSYPYVPASSSTIAVPTSIPKVPNSDLPIIGVSETHILSSTIPASQTACSSAYTSTEPMSANTVTYSQNSPAITPSSSEAAVSSAAPLSSEFENTQPAASSSSSDSISTSPTPSTSTAAEETSTSFSESLQSSGTSGESSSNNVGSSDSTSAENPATSVGSFQSLSTSAAAGSPALTTSTSMTVGTLASTSQSVESSSMSSQSASVASTSSISTAAGTSSSSFEAPSSSLTSGSSSSSVNSLASNDPASRTASETTAGDTNPASPSDTTAGSSSVASGSSQPSLQSTASQPNSSSAGHSNSLASLETVFSTEETTEIDTSFSTTIGQQSTTFVTIVKSTIFSVQISSSTVPAAPGPAISLSVGGGTATSTPPPSLDASTGTCTEDACTDSTPITWPSDESVPIFAPSLSTPTTSSLSLIGLPLDCSYSYLLSNVLYSYYTLDPWCWTNQIPLSGFGDVSTTTIDNLGVVVAQSSAYCVCPRCWLGSDNMCHEKPPSKGPKDSSGQCAEGWWCDVTSDSSTIRHALTSGLCTVSSTPTPWDLFNQCPFTNKDHESTSSVSQTATLITSTRYIHGGYIIFPTWQWKCEDELCKDSCGNLVKIAGDTIKCILTLFRKCKICTGLFGFPWPPPEPPYPPMPDPAHASLTLPTTYCTESAICTPGGSDISATSSGDGQSPTPTSQSSGSSETSSSSRSFSSCSSTTFPSCFEVVTNLNVTMSGSNVTSLTTSTSCTTITACSGTATTTITTLNSTTAAACTLSPWWNDPSISAQIANWITQFPPTTDNGTFFTDANTTQTPTIATSTSSPNSTTSHTTTLGPQISITPSPSHTTSSTLPACGPFTFGSESCTSITKSVTTWSTSASTNPYSIITSTTAGTGSRVTVYTCSGQIGFGTTSCVDSWGLQTVVTTTPPEAVRTSSCVAWTASIAITDAPSAQVLDCAAPVTGKATSTLPVTWTTGMELSPFHYEDWDTSPPALFCKELEDSNIVIVPPVVDTLDTPPGAWARGECHNFYGLTMFGYNLTLQLSYDSSGCDKNDKYIPGISMKKYGWKSCRDVFQNHIAENCQFSAKTAESLGLGDWTMVGGIFYTDCMRWTIISVKSDLSQLDTSPFK